MEGILSPTDKRLLVGQKLKATLSGDYLDETASYSWTIDSGAPFAAYSETQTGGVLTDWETTNSKFTTCYFAKHTLKATITATVTLTSPDAFSFPVEDSVKIESPSTMTMESILGDWAHLLDSAMADTTTNPDHFILFGAIYNQQMMGIWFKGKVLTPSEYVSAGGHGKWHWLNTVTSITGWYRNSSGTWDSDEHFSGAARLDTRVIYNHSGDNPDNTYADDGLEKADYDGPGIDVDNSVLEASFADTLHMYQMYLPPKADSQFVPLNVIDWSCSGTATHGSTWTVNKTPPTASNASAEPNHPRWSDYFGHRPGFTKR